MHLETQSTLGSDYTNKPRRHFILRNLQANLKKGKKTKLQTQQWVKQGARQGWMKTARGSTCAFFQNMIHKFQSPYVLSLKLNIYIKILRFCSTILLIFLHMQVCHNTALGQRKLIGSQIDM